MLKKSTILRVILRRGQKGFSSKIENIFTKQKLFEFNQNGYAILPKVFSAERINQIQEEMKKIVQGANVEELKNVFDGKHISKSSYFSESGDKIRFFLENEALENGELKYPIDIALNKVGHALHDLNEVFERFSYSKEVNFICNMLGYNSPIIVQSMYIFKNNYIGGAVNPHTDNTYLRTTPASCKGIWIALDDATKENGCLWGVPGSHTTPTTYFMKQAKTADGYEVTYNTDEPEYNIEKGQPLEVEKGGVVLLHGDLVHYSSKNTSENQRHAYTLHIVESKDTKWDQDNWLIRGEKMPFRFVYETCRRINTSNL